MKRILFGTIALAVVGGAAVAIVPPAPPPMAHGQTMHGTIGAAMHTRAGVTDRVRQHFVRLDSNRDGYLTKVEAEAGRAAMTGKRGKHVAGEQHPMRDPAAMFDRLDSSRDGMISREEFTRGHQMHQAMRADRDGDGRPEPRMQGKRGHGGGMGGMRLAGRMFDMADANRDARVSLAEATGAALRHFDMADANRDGTLTREERHQMHERMISMKHGNRTS